MNLARLAATRSTCLRRQVGAVIVKDRMVLSTGYNDTPRGLPNCGDGGCERCRSGAAPGSALDTCLCLHAEQNAIVQGALHGVSLRGSTLYVTCQPCHNCAKMIINAGIRRVVFDGEYPDDFAMELFDQANMELIRLRPEMNGIGEKLR